MRSLLESGVDLEGDGLNNLEEFRHNTDPTTLDTDGDGAYDGREVNMEESGSRLDFRHFDFEVLQHLARLTILPFHPQP